MMSCNKKILAIMLVSMFLAAPCSAEVKEFTGSGSYTMSSFETLDVAEQHAFELAERDALEKAGVYVESYTESKNAELTADKITVVTNGVLQIVKKDSKKSLTEDGMIRFDVNITASVDTNKVDESLKNTAQLAQMTEKYNELEAANKQQEAEIAALKQKLASSTSAAEKARIAEAGKAMNNKYLSMQKLMGFSKGEAMSSPQKVFDICTEAIELDPTNLYAHAYRAISAGKLLNYDQAIEDCTYIINKSQRTLDKNFKRSSLISSICNERAFAYLFSKNNKNPQAALQDCNEAISLKGDESIYYVVRSMAYVDCGRYQEGYEDALKAVQLDPNSQSARAVLDRFDIK